MSPAKKVRFTKHQIETAIEVLMESKIVRNWVEGEAQFLGVDLATTRGREFYAREARLAALRLIK